MGNNFLWQHIRLAAPFREMTNVVRVPFMWRCIEKTVWVCLSFIIYLVFIFDRDECNIPAGFPRSSLRLDQGFLHIVRC